MPKTLLSVVISTVLLASCYHDYNPTAPVLTNYDQAMLANRNLSQNVVVVTGKQNEPVTLPFFFTPIAAGAINAKASCSLTDLPPGITATPAAATVDIPGEWAPVLSPIADTGTYDMSIRVQREHGNRTFPFRVHVVAPPPPPNCVICMAGEWTSKNNCAMGEECTVTIDTLPGIPDSVDIRNIDCLGDSVVVRAYLSCDGIIIPRQTTHGYTIYGSKTNSGSLCNYLLMSIGDTVEHNGDTKYCVLHLIRK